MSKKNRNRQVAKGPSGGGGTMVSVATPRSYGLPGNFGDQRPGRNPDPRLQPESTPSQYSTSRPQPPVYVQDVDTGLNWFSPLQPVWPFGPPAVTYPREWDYPTGINIDLTSPRANLYGRLRTMAKTWGFLRTIIERRKDQLLRLPWDVREIGKRSSSSRGDSQAQRDMRAVLRRPDGKRSFSSWSRLLLEDLFVIDAPTIYKGWRRRDGKPHVLQVLDGASIKVIIDDAGRVPDYPSPAYQQIIKGLPMVNFDETEIAFCPMRPQPEMPIYGYSPVEHIYVEVQEAIRKTMYQLGFWKDGNLPDLIMTVPENWTPKQIASFQALMDSNLSGNTSEKSKMRFVPYGMKPYDIKNASGEGLYSSRDEALVRLACYAFAVSPTPFINQINRATADISAETAVMEGLHPLMDWFKNDVWDPIIQKDYGYEELEFVWLPQLEADTLKAAKVHQTYVKAGVKSINEVREVLGDDPVEGGDEPLIYTNNGVLTLKDAIEAGRRMAMQAAEGGNSEFGSNKEPGGAGKPPADMGSKEETAGGRSQ